MATQSSLQPMCSSQAVPASAKFTLPKIFREYCFMHIMQDTTVDVTVRVEGVDLGPPQRLPFVVNPKNRGRLEIQGLKALTEWRPGFFVAVEKTGENSIALHMQVTTGAQCGELNQQIKTKPDLLTLLVNDQIDSTLTIWHGMCMALFHSTVSSEHLLLFFVCCSGCASAVPCGWEALVRLTPSTASTVPLDAATTQPN